MAGKQEDNPVNEDSWFYIIEPLLNASSGEKLVGCLDFAFSQWSLGGLITSHSDPTSWSFISERLLSEIFLGALGSSKPEANLSSSEVLLAFERAFEATELNCNRALVLCRDELAALGIQLEQLESDPNSASGALGNQQRKFLNDRIESCNATINRLNDCVTTCISLIRNEKEMYIANLGDYYAILVTGGKGNYGFSIRQICAPHDLFNVGEHDRLHSLNLSSAEMNNFFSHVGAFNKDLPKFVRCFAGGSSKRPGSPISAVPSIFGPVNIDSAGFIAIYNSAFHNTVEQNNTGTSNVADFVASQVFPLLNLPLGSERQAALKRATENMIRRANLPVEQPHAFFIRWLSDHPTHTPGCSLSLAPLTIDCEGENGFPTWNWSPPPGTVITTANALPQNLPAPQLPIHPPRVEEEPSRANRAANQQQGSPEWIPTYVDLVPTSRYVAESQLEIDNVFADYARGRLSADELRLIGL